MKPIQSALNLLAALAVMFAFGGCASGLQEKGSTAVAAGFKIITPTKPDQVALLPTLPAGKFTQITYEGKILYVLPDVKNNRAYVGGPKQYQAYQRLALEKQISREQVMAAQMNQASTMNLAGWGGFGGPGWMGDWY